MTTQCTNKQPHMPHDWRIVLNGGGYITDICPGVWKQEYPNTQCTNCRGTGWIIVETGVDSYDEYECHVCGGDGIAHTVPEVMRGPSPLKPVEQPRKMEIFYGGLDVEELTIRLDKYLDMKHTNTWPPRQWSVADVESKERAIDWFVDVCIKIGIVDVTADDPRRVIP